MSRPWAFITPSSRGIGFTLTRHLLQRTTLPILATARQDQDGIKARLLENLPAPPLSASSSSSSSSYEKRLTVVPLDVTSEATISAAAEKAAQLFPADTHHLRLAFTMPGILRPERAPRQVDAEEALLTYRVNTLGPLLLMKWFGEFLPRKRTQFMEEGGEDAGGDGDEMPSSLSLPAHAVWMAMSARVGSTSDNRKGGWYSYRSSKAGVNSLVKSFDHQLVARSGEKAMAVAYHPGTVRTDLSKDYWATVAKDKLFEPEFAVEKMVEVVTRKVGVEGRGRCWDWKGEEILP